MAPRRSRATVTSYRDRLRQVGLRSTGPRLHVLDIMERATSPMSHAEVAKELRHNGFDHATIYRNLVDMTEAGLLVRSDLGDHVWRFELRRGQHGHSHDGAHPHFMCTACGVVSCLPGATILVRSGKGAPRAVKQRKIAVQLRGRCDACQRRAS